MSYYEIGPSYYQANMPGTPWHAGAPGWATAPWVTWGGNPVQAGPPWQGTNGLGCPGGCGQATTTTGLGPLVKVGIGAGVLIVAYALWQQFRATPGFRANARWSQAYKNRLPDRAFLYVEPGGRKETIRGRTYTVPRAKRKFPVRDVTGRVDRPHVRNALSRIGRSGVPESTKPRLEAKARRLLAGG